MIQVAVVDLATIVGLASIVLYILSSVKFFPFLILLCIWGSRNFHYNDEAEQFCQLTPKPKYEEKHNKPDTVKAKTARAKEKARANERANAERKARDKAEKARAKEQARASERANAEKKAQVREQVSEWTPDSSRKSNPVMVSD
jgi:biopolymer transport protein ExbB/TolQ